MATFMIWVMAIILVIILITCRGQIGTHFLAKSTDKYLESSPEDKRLAEVINSLVSQKSNLAAFSDLSRDGVKIVLADIFIGKSRAATVITKNMLYSYEGPYEGRGYLVHPPSFNGSIKLSVSHEIDSYTTSKTKSIGKSALVGGVVAGPVGAVVGAAHAIDSNANGGKKETHLYYNGHVNMEVSYIGENCCAGGHQVSELLISNELIDKIGAPIDDKEAQVMDEYTAYNLEGYSANDLQKFIYYIDNCCEMINS